MKKILLILILLLLQSLVATAQEPLISSMQSKIEKIENGRFLLLDAVIEGNKSKASEIVTHLSQLEDSNYISLYPAEKWLINYWMANHKSILSDFEDFDYEYVSTRNTRVGPRNDMLYQKLIERLRKDQDQVNKLINEAALSQIDKDFLSLNFIYLLSGFDYLVISQNDLNTYANDFLDKYDQSIYEDYIRKFIRIQYKPSDWRMSYEFFSGYGIFTEDLSTNFKNNVPIGIAFDISYKRYMLYLRNYIGFSRTLDALSFESGTWEENAQVRVFLPEISLGYVLYDKDFIKIAPFTGISWTAVSPTENDINRFPEYQDIGLNFSSTYTYGINSDFKLGSGLISSYEKSNWFIRVRYAYNQPQFSKKYQGYDGNFHYLTIGFGQFTRRVSREY